MSVTNLKLFPFRALRLALTREDAMQVCGYVSCYNSVSQHSSFMHERKNCISKNKHHINQIKMFYIYTQSLLP